MPKGPSKQEIALDNQAGSYLLRFCFTSFSNGTDPSVSMVPQYNNATPSIISPSLRTWSLPNRLLALAAGALASVASTDDDSSFDFEKWFKTEAFPHHDDYNVLMDTVVARIRAMTEAELQANSKAVVDFLISVAGNDMSKLELSRVLEDLDLFWDVIDRLDGLYAFSGQCSAALALESQVHRVNNDLTALRRSQTAHWKLMRQYEMLGQDLHKDRSSVAFDLAVLSALESDCDQALFYLKDAASYSRKLRLTPTTAKDEMAEAMLANLVRQMAMYVSLKEVADSPCRQLFKAGARDAYDLIKTVDPVSLPSFLDFKAAFKRRYLHEQQSPQPTSFL